MLFLNCLIVNLILINGLQEDDFLDSKQAQRAQLEFNHIFWSTINSTNLETIKISSPCVDSLKSVNEGLESGQQWSTKLLESSGHFPINAINSGYSDFGDYDSCLSVNWSNEVGKHCTISLLPTLNESEWSVNPWTRNKPIDIEHEAVLKIGLCIPSKCSKTDLTSIFTLALKQDQWHLIKVDQCTVKLSLRQKLIESNLHQKLSLIFLFAIFSINLYATWIDWSFQSSKYRWTRHFSLMKNYNQLITPNVSSRSDFITKFGIIVHLYTLTAHIIQMYIYLSGWSLFNYKFLRHGMMSAWVVEILFVYGGLTRSLELWRITGQSTSIVSSFKHLIIKMLQIIILQLFLFAVTLIRPLIADGPMSSIFNDNDCKKSIWFNLIFWQNNYRPGNQMCSPHTWSVAVEFQLLPLVIILIHLYKRKPKIAVILNSLIVIGGLIYVTFHTQIKYLVLSLSLNLGSIRMFADFMESTYLPTSMHLWIYLMGPLWTYLIMNNHQLIEKLRKISIVKVFIALSTVPFIFLQLTNYYDGAILNFILGFNYRLLIILFYSIIIMTNSQQLKSFFNNSMDRNWSNNNQMDDKINKSTDSVNNQYNQRFLHFVSNLLRSTYYIHVALIVTIYAIQRQPIVTYSSLIMIILKCLVVSLFGGFIFHLFVTNPVNNLISSFRSKGKTT